MSNQTISLRPVLYYVPPRVRNVCGCPCSVQFSVTVHVATMLQGLLESRHSTCEKAYRGLMFQRSNQ